MAKNTASRTIVAENLRLLRRSLGMSQEKLAEAASLHRTYVGSVERGERNLSLDNLDRLASALNVQAVDLLTEVALGSGMDDRALFEHAIPALRRLQQLASKHLIHDIFQDNGGKLLQIILLTGLTVKQGREGNDAIDETTGRECELKSVNRSLTKSFSTHHHLNPGILAKYRNVDWYFAVYEGIELVSLYKVLPGDLEVYFSAWEKKWRDSGGKDINNPKIPLKHVERVGTLLHQRISIVAVKPIAPAPKTKIRDIERPD